LKIAGEDGTVRTAVLDARHVAGSRELVDELDSALRLQLHARAAELIDEQHRGMQDRHTKYGESLYLLQPNVKEGVGGLRDYHAAWWSARVVHGSVHSFMDLAALDLLTEAELVAYAVALDFLWRVRNELHRLTGRRTDQLAFDLQERLAESFGYADREGPELPVERFMGDYYRAGRSVQSASELLLDLCDQHTRPPDAVRETREVEEGFRLSDEQLEIPHPTFLAEHPFRLIRAFEVAQGHGVPLSRMAARLVRENLGLVNDAFRRDAAVAACFERILQSEERVMRTLLAMNDSGLLGAYLPEWEHIVCRWQQVIYHTYTVDVHSIFVVEELRRLWRGKYELDMGELTDMMRAVEDRVVLFLGCLFHDIGKGLGGDHSRKGTELARQALERMGMAPERRERVAFLVEHHLRMSHLAQRRDLSDPKLIVDFARSVGDRENLRNLYLLTFADIRASSRSAWSDWKGQLLTELFERTSEFLETGDDDPQRAVELIEARVERRQEAARRELRALGVADSKVQAYFDDMPRRYFMAHSAQQIARHAMVMLSFRPDRVVTTRVRSMPGDFSELIVVTRDVHALYAKVAGVITARWINILGSHVYTSRSGLALEVYRLTTPAGPPEQRRDVWRGLESALHHVLSGVVEVEELLARRRRPLGAAESPSREPVTVSVSNAESDFYTIVDVSANDRLGLLYDLTRTIADAGLEIYISKASTILDQVADTFYLKDADGKKILDRSVLDALRVALLQQALGPREKAGA
jgi:[protein-PII] uridylyltransferase